RRHTRSLRDWSSDVCSSDLVSDRRRLELLDLLLGRRDIPRMPLRVALDLPGERDLTDHHRLTALRLDAGHRLALHLLELARVERSEERRVGKVWISVGAGRT